jgi:hypothetical protein
MTLVNMVVPAALLLILGVLVAPLLESVQFVCKEKTYATECNGTKEYGGWISAFGSGAASGSSCVIKKLVPQADGSFIETKSEYKMYEQVSMTSKDMKQINETFGFNEYADWDDCSSKYAIEVKP